MYNIYFLGSSVNAKGECSFVGEFVKLREKCICQLGDKLSRRGSLLG